MTMSEPARLIHWGGSSRSMYSKMVCSPDRQMTGALLERLPRVRTERPLAFGVRRKNRVARSAAV
jgi:hypothetical protein